MIMYLCICQGGYFIRLFAGIPKNLTVFSESWAEEHVIRCLILI